VAPRSAASGGEGTVEDRKPEKGWGGADRREEYYPRPCVVQSATLNGCLGFAKGEVLPEKNPPCHI